VRNGKIFENGENFVVTFGTPFAMEDVVLSGGKLMRVMTLQQMFFKDGGTEFYYFPFFLTDDFFHL
jgi:hypothetical protein